jgi:hypothetical protein
LVGVLLLGAVDFLAAVCARTHAALNTRMMAVTVRNLVMPASCKNILNIGSREMYIGFPVPVRFLRG